MSRHTKYDNAVLFVIKLEINRMVIFMAIKNKKAENTSFLDCCIFVKIFDPIQANLIYCPAIFVCCDLLIRLQLPIIIPKLKVKFAFYNYKQQNYLTKCIHVLDYCNLFLITRLYYFYLSDFF